MYQCGAGAYDLIEAIVYVQASGNASSESVSEATSATLRAHLAHAAAVVRDFGAIRELLLAVATELDASAADSAETAAGGVSGTSSAAELAAFVRWLHVERSKHFLLMGATYGEVQLGIQDATPGAATAALRTVVGDGDSWPNSAHQSGGLGVRKSEVESTVHRRGRIDEILISVGAGDSKVCCVVFYLCFGCD